LELADSLLVGSLKLRLPEKVIDEAEPGSMAAKPDKACSERTIPAGVD